MIRLASGSEASPTNQTPSPYDGAAVSATAIATVVLPIPPGPTIVTSRCWVNCTVKFAMTSSRPMIRTSETGRLLALTASSRANLPRAAPRVSLARQSCSRGPGCW